MMHFLIRHRNTLLFALLVLTMLISCLADQSRRSVETASVSIPVVQTGAAPTGRLDTLRRQREDTALADMAALQSLCAEQALDAQTREDAAARLSDLVDAREKQSALECALAENEVTPCLAILTPGCVTIVTDRTDLTADARAQVLALAWAHTGVDPSGVRLICGNE